MDFRQIPLSLALIFFFPLAEAAVDTISLDTGWQYAGSRVAVADPADLPWRPVGVPVCNLPEAAEQWWRHPLNIPASWRDRHVRLELLAAARESTVWVNGSRLEGQSGTFDLTPTASLGSAQVLIRLQCNEREVCGIIEARVVATPRVYLAGQAVRTAGKTLEISTSIRNTLENTVNVDLHWELSFKGRVVATGAAAATVPPALTQPAVAILKPVGGLYRWNIYDPNLYTLRTILVKNAEAIEGDTDMEISSTVAARDVQRLTEGWRINGENVRLRSTSLSSRCYPARDFSAISSEEVISSNGLPIASWLREAADRSGVLITQEQIPGSATVQPRVRILSAFLHQGDTVVEIENVNEDASYSLRHIRVTVGHVEQSVEELKPGEKKSLRFEHVNPYRIEVRSSSGAVLATR